MGKRINVDWNAIKNEYVSGVQRGELMKKYGVSEGAMTSRITREGWAKLRRNRKAKNVKAHKKSDEDNLQICLDIGHTLLEKIRASAEACDIEDTARIKSLTSAMKDLREIKVFVADIDKAEQEMRIAKLKADADGNNKDTEIVIRFADDSMNDLV